MQATQESFFSDGLLSPLVGFGSPAADEVLSTRSLRQSIALLVSVDFSPRSLYTLFACKTPYWQGSVKLSKTISEFLSFTASHPHTEQRTRSLRFRWVSLKRRSLSMPPRFVSPRGVGEAGHRREGLQQIEGGRQDLLRSTSRPRSGDQAVPCLVFHHSPPLFAQTQELVVRRSRVLLIHRFPSEQRGPTSSRSVSLP